MKFIPGLQGWFNIIKPKQTKLSFAFYHIHEKVVQIFTEFKGYL